MLLRRMISHVKDQNWLAVFLDFVIVVFGVFIGIQVSNWNDERVTREKRDELLRDVANDLQADIIEIDITMDAAAQRFAAAEAIVSRAVGWTLVEHFPAEPGETYPLQRPDSVLPETAGEALFFSQRYMTFDVERRTYDGLLSTGDIIIIRPTELAEALRAHYADVQSWAEAEKTDFRQTHAHLRAALARNGLAYYEVIDWSELEAVAASDKEVLGLLKSTAYEAAVQVTALSAYREQTERLLSQIKDQQ